MAKVINAESALANFPAEAHDEEDTLHEGCNEEHDPTCGTNVRTGVTAMVDDQSYSSNLYLAWIEVSHALDWRNSRNTHRIVMLYTMMKPPGVWINIIGMLSAPTSLRR